MWVRAPGAPGDPSRYRLGRISLFILGFALLTYLILLWPASSLSWNFFQEGADTEMRASDLRDFVVPAGAISLDVPVVIEFHARGQQPVPSLRGQVRAWLWAEPSADNLDEPLDPTIEVTSAAAEPSSPYTGSALFEPEPCPANERCVREHLVTISLAAPQSVAVTVRLSTRIWADSWSPDAQRWRPGLAPEASLTLAVLGGEITELEPNASDLGDVGLHPALAGDLPSAQVRFSRSEAAPDGAIATAATLIPVPYHGPQVLLLRPANGRAAPPLRIAAGRAAMFDPFEWCSDEGPCTIAYNLKMEDLGSADSIIAGFSIEGSGTRVDRGLNALPPARTPITLTDLGPQLQANTLGERRSQEPPRPGDWASLRP